MIVATVVIVVVIVVVPSPRWQKLLRNRPRRALSYLYLSCTGCGRGGAATRAERQDTNAAS